MTQDELNQLVGKKLLIRETPHLCIAAGRDMLLLLQLAGTDETLFKEGDPVQYAVAWHPSFHADELVWANGSYFPLLAYRDSGMPPSAQALRDAVDALYQH